METKTDTLHTGTCGVRFLSTSQLLVLVELSVLHVVPAKGGNTRKKRTRIRHNYKMGLLTIFNASGQFISKSTTCGVRAAPALS